MLEKQQQQIYDKVMDNIEYILNPATLETDKKFNVVSISGAAGTGKTFLAAEILKSLQKRKITVIATTPTHQSLNVLTSKLKLSGVNNLANRTIHSFLNLKLKIDYKTGNQSFIEDSYNKDNKKYDILLVDESSMISEEIFKLLLAQIGKRIRGIIFVGDMYQLPPVDGEPNEVGDLPWSYELTDILRQEKDSDIIGISTKIRDKINEGSKQSIKDVLDIDSLLSSSDIKLYADRNEFQNSYLNNGLDKMISCYTNARVDLYNEKIRNAVYQENAKFRFLVGETLIFQESYFRGDDLIHMNGERVEISGVELNLDETIMCYIWKIKTTRGTYFEVVDLDSAQNFNFALEQHKKSAYTAATPFLKKQAWQKFYDLKLKYAVVRYGFSCTIHKMQGTTVSANYFDLGELYQYDFSNARDTMHRLVYVAVTRPSKELHILI